MRNIIHNLSIYFFALIFIFLNNDAYSYYATPGTGVRWNLDSLVFNSSGHITFTGGSYHINDTLTISQSDTIKILTNALIYMSFNSLVNVNANGTLIINPPDSVKFTVTDTNSKYIGFVINTSNTTIFKKTIMEFGNSISLLYSNILIDSCIIRNNNYYTTSLKSGAISLFYSSPTITHNMILRNRRAAVVSAVNIPCSPIITDNLIFENDTENGLYPQLNLGAGSTTPVIIRNNIIRGLYTNSGGIAFLPSSTTITNIIIENNTIKKNSYGIVLYNVNINAYINNNIIDSNNINPTAGSGIFINGDTTIATIITRNKIRWNLWGVSILGTPTNNPIHAPKIDLGNLSNLDTSDNGYNEIYRNMHNGLTYDIADSTMMNDTIKAENNFWGTTNLDSIEAHIHDKLDNPVLDFVDVTPILNLNSININNENIYNYKLFNAYPNPFNPSTKITYEVPAVSISSNSGINTLVNMKIFDVLGKEIATLVNENKSSGIYDVVWDASNFPSGIYFCKLTAGTFSNSKKLMLIK